MCCVTAKNTWAITARDSEDGAYIIDGVYVFDENGKKVRGWDVENVFHPRGSEDTNFWKAYGLQGRDWAHANAVSVRNSGDFLFSLTGIHSVLLINGESGGVTWELNGEDGGDFTITGSDTDNNDFFGQHHVWQRENGNIVLFDDRNTHECGAQCEEARVIELKLTENHAGDKTARIVREFPIGEQCSTQGSAYDVGDNMLISCSSCTMVKEIDEQGLNYWEMRFSCAPGSTREQPLYRAAPFSF